MRCVVGVIGSLVLLAASPVAAVEAGTAFEDWVVECEKVPDGKKRCVLSQSQLLKESNARVLKVSIGYLGLGREPQMVMVLPLGIDLRSGAALKIDDQPQSPFTPQHCVQEGCVASRELSPKVMKALSDAKLVQIGVLPYGAKQTVTMNVSPKGLKAGLNALKEGGE